MLFWPSPVTAWVNQRRDPMSALLDDVSRIIASPISRRQTLRLVCGAVGSAVLASLGFGRPSRGLGSPDPGNPGFVTCPQGQTACGSNCCGSGQTCCNNQICCPHNASCCGTGSALKCCPPGKVCCSGLCCKAGPSPSSPCISSSNCT